MMNYLESLNIKTIFGEEKQPLECLNYEEYRDMLGNESEADKIAPKIDSILELKGIVKPVELIVRRVRKNGKRIFRDEGISGAKLNEEELEIDRVGLQEMLAHLSSVQIDYVVVLNTRRLWRSDFVKVLVHREFK